MVSYATIGNLIYCVGADIGFEAVISLYWWLVFFFSSRRRHTRLQGDWSSDVCSSDLIGLANGDYAVTASQLLRHEAGGFQVGGFQVCRAKLDGWRDLGGQITRCGFKSARADLPRVGERSTVGDDYAARALQTSTRSCDGEPVHLSIESYQT